MAAIFAALPIIPLVWVPLRDRSGLPVEPVLSALVALAGAWVLLKLIGVKGNRTPLRMAWIAVIFLIFLYFLAILENPVEKVHFLEYGWLGFLGFHCLRSTWTRWGIWRLRWATVGLAACVGLIDEGIQYILPNRYGEIRDVGFNMLAGLLGLAATELWLHESGRDIPVEETC